MDFIKSQSIKKQGLRIRTLSGTESVTKNMTLYEYGDDIIIVDCGVAFPDDEMYGVDVVIPDFTYILENSHKLRGLVLTHGHEDHIGAVPYLLQQLNVPIYAGKLVQGFLKERFRDRSFARLADSVKYNLLEPNGSELSLGSFKISAFGVNHSVPASMGLVIKTPEGTVLHMADYKIDWTPILDEPMDLGKVARYGNEGVLCLLSDCLNVTTEGYSKSESTLNNTFLDLLESANGRQFLVTTISSNISRMYQIISSAIKHGRRVVVSGRSIDQSIAVARKLGYLPFDEAIFVSEKEAAKYPQSDLVYLIAGCYGQSGSSLDRVGQGEHDFINLEKNALVVFSADPNPPGVEIEVERVMANLTLLGAEVVYSKIQNNLHVSGHGTKGDLISIASVVKPKYFIPIGGTITRMRAYTNMVAELGVEKNRVFECREGESVEFSNGYAHKGPMLTTKPVFMTSKANEVSPVVVKDRGQLSSEGVFVVVVPVSKKGQPISNKIEIITRGFIYVKASRELMDKSKGFISKAIGKRVAKAKEWNDMRRILEADIERFLYKETGRSPLVIVHSITV